MSREIEFTIKVSMGDRWVPHFLGLLREMEQLGQVGSSRMLGFYSDGDGDYRPRFEWDADAEPAHARPGGSTPPVDSFWDAG